MRKILLLLILASPACFGYASYSGFCEQGGVKVATQGMQSTTTFQQSYPNLAQSGTGPEITVYLAGTTTKAAIYSDNAGTVKANPFPCATTGQYLFFSATGQVDLLFSGTGISSFTRASIQGIDPLFPSDGVMDCAGGNPMFCFASLQAAVTFAAANGKKLYITQTWALSGVVTIPSMTIQCTQGSLIKAAANSMTMLTFNGASSVDACTLDGQFSQGKTGIVAIGSTGTYLKITNSVIQNIDNYGISLAMTGTFISSYNRYLSIGSGLPLNTNVGVGIYDSATGGSAPHPALLVSSYDIFNNFTTGDSIHLFNGNLASKTAVVIDHDTFISQATAAVECSILGAVSLKVTEINVVGFENNGNNGPINGVSCQMNDTNPANDNDGSIVIEGGTINTGGSPTAGHGLGMEIFSRHFKTYGTQISGPFASAIICSGECIADNMGINGAYVGVAADPTFTQLSWKITNSVLKEICEVGIGSVNADILVDGNSFYRTPANGVCTTDAAHPYIAAYVGPNAALSATGVNNHVYLLAGTAPGGSSYTGLNLGNGDYGDIRGNRFVDLNMTPLLTAIGGVVVNSHHTIQQNRFNNVAVAVNPTNVYARTGGNIDETGNLTTAAKGAYILDNVAIAFAASDLLCGAFNIGTLEWFTDSSTATFGGAISGSGMNQVQGGCSLNGPAWTVAGK